MSQHAARTILILDTPTIAHDLQGMLEADGFRNIEVIGNCADAEIWVMNRTPSVAVMDVELEDGSSACVAKMLLERNVPTIVCSSTAKSDADDAFGTATWIAKPCTPAMLTAAVYLLWDIQHD